MLRSTVGILQAIALTRVLEFPRLDLEQEQRSLRHPEPETHDLRWLLVGEAGGPQGPGAGEEGGGGRPGLGVRYWTGGGR